MTEPLKAEQMENSAKDEGPAHSIIEIVQLPVIYEQLAALSAGIDAQVSEALAMECTEETVRGVKKLRAAIGASFKTLEARRIQVKKEIMAPYERFDAVYRQYISNKYTSADAQLKGKIDAVEDGLKNQKHEELKAFFDECAAMCPMIDLTYERWNPNVTLSASMKSLKDSAREYVNRVTDEFLAIEDMVCADEIMVEYKKTLNLSDAISTVTQRHKALEEQQALKAEYEARRAAEAEAVSKVEAVVAIQAPEPLAPPKEAPKPVDDPVRTVAFRVTAPLSKLKALKAFLIEGGYQYE